MRKGVLCDWREWAKRWGYWRPTRLSKRGQVGGVEFAKETQLAKRGVWEPRKNLEEKLGPAESARRGGRAEVRLVLEPAFWPAFLSLHCPTSTSSHHRDHDLHPSVCAEVSSRILSVGPQHIQRKKHCSPVETRQKRGRKTDLRADREHQMPPLQASWEHAVAELLQMAEPRTSRSL